MNPLFAHNDTCFVDPTYRPDLQDQECLFIFYSASGTHAIVSFANSNHLQSIPVAHLSPHPRKRVAEDEVVAPNKRPRA